MTRNEFIAELRGRLAVLPPEERENALQYYEEYFDDAGPENEQAVIQELGSPENVANRILSGEGNIVGSYAWRTPTRGSTAKQADTMGLKIAVAVLAVLSSPVWLTLLLVFAALLFSAVILAAAALLAVFAMAVAAAVVCVACLAVGVRMVFTDPVNGGFVLSIGLMGLGGALILFPLLGLIWKKAAPYLKKWAGKAAGVFTATCKKAWEGLQKFVSNLTKK